MLQIKHLNIFHCFSLSFNSNNFIQNHFVLNQTIENIFSIIFEKFYKYSHLLKGTNNNETKFQIYIPQKEPNYVFF